VLPTEVLTEALKRRSSCALSFTHGKPPCEHTRAPDAAASTASHPAFVTIAKRPSCRVGTVRAGRTDLPDKLSEIFFSKGLDSFLLICPVGWAVHFPLAPFFTGPKRAELALRGLG
jgi:hypothetical protein